VYPNLTDEEKYAIWKFVDTYENTYRPLISTSKTDSNYIENMLFIIYYINDDSDPKDDYRLKYYDRTISKMYPDTVEVLENVLKDYKKYKLIRRDLKFENRVRREDRKAKKTNKVDRRCKCK